MVLAVHVHHESDLVKVLHQAYGKAEDFIKSESSKLSTYRTMLSLFRNSVSFLHKAFGVFAKHPTAIFKVLKIPLLIKTPLIVHRLGTHLLKVIDLDTPLMKRISHIFKAIISVNKLGKAAATICHIGKFIGVFGKKALSWLRPFGLFSFAVSIIRGGYTLQALYKHSVLLHTLRVGLSKIHQTGNHDAKVDAALELLNSLKSKKIEVIRKHLKISEASRLAEKVDIFIKTLRTKSATDADVAEVDSFLRIMRNRSALIVSMDCIRLITKALSIVGSALTLFSPLKIEGAAILAVGSAISTMRLAAQFFFLRTNPFDPDSTTTAGEVFNKAKKHVQSVGKIVSESLRDAYSTLHEDRIKHCRAF